MDILIVDDHSTDDSMQKSAAIKNASAHSNDMPQRNTNFLISL
ncbi:hypothetical protein PO124_16525 [Bacillus licheniformis]|nr:hypothetical protein [Bacillus licheniformis]